jgi:Flp pilus assembly protein CpaB
MGRRTILIIILVISFIALAVIGIIYIQQQNQPAAPVETVAEDGSATGDGDLGAEAPTGLESEALATAPSMVEVVVSLQTVPRGWQMTEAELATDMRLAEEVGSDVITNLEDAIGLFARTDIFQGETLTKANLVSDVTLVGVEEYGPSSLIPPGFIAASVPLDRLSGVAYALDEGDYIDIMMTFYFYQIDEQFQTYLENAAVFFLEDTVETTTEGAEGETVTEATNIFVLWPYGRFEELPTGDTVHVYGSEYQRPVPISMILQNARVIQVGNWAPPEPVMPATPTPVPLEDGEPTPTPAPGQIPPTTTPYPDVLLVALTPQQQLFLKYAVESRADIDFALRGANDNQLYTVQNVDVNFILERFNIEVPPGFNYSVDIPVSDATPTPNAPAEEATGPDNE